MGSLQSIENSNVIMEKVKEDTQASDISEKKIKDDPSCTRENPPLNKMNVLKNDNMLNKSLQLIGDEMRNHELDLIYDHVLGCYYDPKTNLYYELKNN
jgi:hypothetical protein